MWTNKLEIKGNTISEKEENAKKIIRDIYIYNDRIISTSKKERIKQIINEYNRLKKEPLPDDLIGARIFKMEQKEWTQKYFMECVNVPLSIKMRDLEKDIPHSRTYKGKINYKLGKPNYTKIYDIYNQEEIEKLKKHKNKNIREIGTLLENYKQLLDERKQIDIDIHEIDSKIKTEKYLEIMRKYNEQKLSEEELLNMYPKIHRKRNMEMLEIQGVPYTPIIQKYISRNPKSFISGKSADIVHHLDSYSVNKYEKWVNDDINLVSLTSEEHDEFHKIYGNKNNTRNQFNEFLKSKGLDSI